jgi:hypothetical protein
MAKSNTIPPSLQPRKMEKKPIPTSALGEPAPLPRRDPEPVHEEMPAKPKPEKKRFTLWLSNDVYRAFKIHTAGNDGSASDYLEELIRRDLNL